MNLRLGSGEPLRLGRTLTGRTGEGTVYDLADRRDLVAKVFHDDLTELDQKLRKVAAMVQSQPPGAVQPDGFVVLTWPQDMIVGPHGPVGYVMRRIDTATSVELHTMSNPSDRAHPAPTGPQWTKNAGWGHLVNVAANLCLAVEVCHRVEAVIGDFQERNILVSDTTRVTLVDCDSMQFTDSSGHRFLCAVGRPEFTAPELAGRNLRQVAREKTSDLFALAVHIHQLLLAGNHPFSRGQWTGDADQPDALTLAVNGEWAGGPGSRLRTHPLAPPVSFLPPEIGDFFVRAFTEGAREPAARPTAGQWRSALLRIRLERCSQNRHEIPLGCAVCPWCAIDAERASRQHNPWARSSGPRPAVSSAGFPAPAAPPRPVEAPNSDKFLGMNSRTYLVALIAVVVVVVSLAVFIVWAVLSGASTLGT
ncbi:hypothetical protein [Mycobacterium sp. PSTR-4-N]|uniref:protein kinase domain-containing protein n=1 Tax=Mycobacterium sp. PSTR-4-N TaxID=2917745 RepID=UPI001F1500EB|nr:hypothetical protein [Mycobacterium sp. PSTR-4-N]MCG7592747.1 hypothetical protein [Mycobacterium sp. PSTR-4-N]